MEASGNIYSFPRDNHGQSLMVLSLRSPIRSKEIKDFWKVFLMLFMIFRTEACVPEYMESFGLIIDMKDNACSKKFLKKVNFLSLNLKLFSLLSGFLMDVAPLIIKKIYFYGTGERDRPVVDEFIERLEGSVEIGGEREVDLDLKYLSLEEKFGGIKRNIVRLWPPTSFFQEEDVLDDECVMNIGIIPFSFTEDYKILKKSTKSE